MRFLTSDIIFTGSDPVNGGVLVIDDSGRIVEILEAEPSAYTLEHLEYYKGFLCPAFVNTHCHLELSWAEGLVSEGKGLHQFLIDLDALRRQQDAESVEDAIFREGDQLLRTGTVAVADISNTLSTAKFKETSTILFHTFAEVFASDPSRAGLAFEKVAELAQGFRSMRRNNRVSITPHATYSLSEELFRLIAAETRRNNSLVSIHHQETEEENLYFRNGSGLIAERRKFFNPGIAPFQPTAKSPLESIAAFFDKSQSMLLVHNTLSREQDISFGENYFERISWCFCPNANLYIEGKVPDIPLFRRKGCHITLGTDSLASNYSLSLLEEIKTISRFFPEIPLCEMLDWATKNGAELLGFGQLGTFEKNKRPGVVLIENVDSEKPCLKDSSCSSLLIPHGL